MDPAAAPQHPAPDPSLAPPPRRWRTRLLRGLAVIGLTAAVLLGALWALLRIALMPQTGEWATELGRGPLALRAGVPQLVGLATTPWIGERLDGIRIATRLGPVTLGWRAASGRS